jgi:HD-GYP domain-containing protein (c-di-GMP phosphodiesterase class II)
MVSDRPYREARSFDQAIEVFRRERNSGQWDPALVDLFLEMMHTMEPESIVHV